jgi:glucokinase
MADAYLVFESGGTKLVAAVAGHDCRIAETTVLYRARGDRAAKSFGRLIEAGRELQRKHEQQGASFRAVGFGFGGYVRRSVQKPLRCLHEEGWEDLDVAADLERAFRLPVVVENDCKLGALGEAHFGAGKGSRTLFYMTIGTGVGGGIVRDGHIQAMSDVGEAEIGHIVVAPDGPPCWCGRRGCVEAVCSGPGMSQLAAWMAEREPDAWRESGLRPRFASADEAGSKDLMQAWEAGDPFAASVIETSAGYLASAVSAAINLISPDVFVVGGGVGAGSERFLQLLRDKVRGQVVPCFRDQYRIVPSELREQAVTQGAAILAAQTVGGFREG